MLQDRGFPAGRLALLETEEYAGLLQEFAGEIQITQVISPDAFKDIDIAFFTCSAAIMESYIARVFRIRGPYVPGVTSSIRIPPPSSCPAFCPVWTEPLVCNPLQ